MLNPILSERGDTIPRQAAKRWGVPAESIDAFYEALWRVLTEELGIPRAGDADRLQEQAAAQLHRRLPD